MYYVCLRDVACANAKLRGRPRPHSRAERGRIRDRRGHARCAGLDCRWPLRGAHAVLGWRDCTRLISAARSVFSDSCPPARYLKCSR